jgi:hypothetical protein
MHTSVSSQSIPHSRKGCLFFPEIQIRTARFHSTAAFCQRCQKDSRSRHSQGVILTILSEAKDPQLRRFVQETRFFGFASE